MFVSYFRGILNLMRSEESVPQGVQKEVEFVEVLRALQRLLGHNDVYFRYLSKFKIRQRPISGENSLKQEAVKKFRKMQEIFKN
jgi:hypothetical protein